jgi:hypothetical protein
MSYVCKDTQIVYLDEKISWKTGKPMDEDEFREYFIAQIERTLPLKDIQDEFTVCIKNDVSITSMCSWVQLELDKKYWNDVLNRCKYEVIPIEGMVVKVTLGAYLGQI